MESVLAEHVAALDVRTAELARSRARLVQADDRVRRELERAISRDVLPHLLAVSAGLREGADVEELVGEVNTGLEALRELTRGVFPAQLARTGLRSLPPSVTIAPALEGRRFASQVETALFFCCVRAPPGRLDLEDDELVLSLPGVRAYDEDVRDRVEAAGGSVSVSRRGLCVRVPAEAQASDSRSGPKDAFVT
jgi:hypothetical protein